jgi:hypothetical protein
MTILMEITSDTVLDAAYEWLCQRRCDYSANAGVWGLRRDWAHEKQRTISSCSRRCGGGCAEQSGRSTACVGIS